ncbi:MAG: methyltransferase domain-containing protein [Planctomycetes bacterium]|nr:methyltransferase domain-containing protein [Planctomycetota bacterium]
MLRTLLRGRTSSESPEIDEFIRAGYRAILGREADASGFADFQRHLLKEKMTPGEFLEALAYSEEGQQRRTSCGSPLNALHAARMQMVRQLPAAKTIVDLGGACQDDPRGALVVMGYPYPFETNTIIEAPREERHDIYKNVCADAIPDVDTGRGVVKYLFRSMADLSPIADGSVDLVYSGESIEHVTREEAERVFKEAHRILKPGGEMCFDTPNRAVTKIQVPNSYINPDHKWEYTHAELSAMITRNGFEIREAKGIALMAESARTGKFEFEELIKNAGMYDAIEKCYLLYYRCRKA